MPIRYVSAAALTLLAPTLLAFVCTSCRKDDPPSPSTAQSSHQNSRNNTGSQPSAPSAHTSAASSNDPEPVHGLWAQRPFTTQSALVQVEATWITVTLFNRPASCTTTRLSPTDLAVQFTLPSGPDNAFFPERNIPVELQLHGAGGVSHVPAGHVIVNIKPFHPATDQQLHGYLKFAFRTAHDAQAPTYDSEGVFHATVCNNQPTQPSAASTETAATSIRGSISGRDVTMRTVHVYQRDNGFGGKILMLKAYEGEVPCHTSRSATPYLFGAEIGPDKNNQYTTGKLLPAGWKTQMRVRQFSERSVQTAHGAGWVQLDFVHPQPKPNDIAVRGIMFADNRTDEPDWRFFLSGKFEATFCGTEVQAW